MPLMGAEARRHLCTSSWGVCKRCKLGVRDPKMVHSAISSAVLGSALIYEKPDIARMTANQ